MTKKKAVLYWIIVIILACLVAFIEGNIRSRQELREDAQQEKQSLPAIEESGEKLEKRKSDEGEAPYKRMTWDEYMQQQHDHIGEGEE